MPDPAVQRLLTRHGWCRVEPLTGDASTRRYSRLHKLSGETAVLVEYPASIRRELARDLAVNAWCRDRGLRVATVRDGNVADGWALLEDLGTNDAEAILATAPVASRRELLGQLLAPLEVLAACSPDELPSWNSPLDRTRLRWELAGFELWYLRHFRSTAPWPQLGGWLDGLADEVAGHPLRVCHRDYHLNNLLPQADGAVAVIDVQDILVGPDSYDAVSLLAERATTRLVSGADRDAVLEAWARRTAAGPGWRDRAAAVRLQRGLKVLGSFARFIVEGRSGYRPWLAELERRLAAPLEARCAPPRLTALLLD